MSPRPLRVLVLGGTSFVGPALIDAARDRGHAVTAFSRGRSALHRADVEHLRGDRTSRDGRAALRNRSWDVVLDTWSGSPDVAAATAADLATAGYYGYVSTRSVYRWPVPPGADESAPLVEVADCVTSDDPGERYAGNKRGAEQAVLEHFAGRALLARAGLILGPRENIWRLPWWLQRMARGGPVLAPGPPDRPLQYVDARDLAAWTVRCAEAGVTGAFNAVGPVGAATIGSVLEACRRVTGGSASLVWATAADIAAAGIQPWTELPIWLPPHGEGVGMHDGDVSRALAAGLRCRPVEETVADTWAWLQATPAADPSLDRPRPGLAPAKEAAVLRGLLRC